MSDLKLHEINESLSKLELLLENEADIKPYLDGVELQQKEKAKQLFLFMQKYSNFDAEIGEEIKRLQTLRKHYKTHYEQIKGYISYSMGANRIEMIETDMVKFSFRKSTSVEIEDEAKLSPEFLKVKYTPDKTAIGKELKAGGKVDGAFLKSNNLLQIK